MITYDSSYLINTIAYALRLILLLSAPMLISAVAVGVLISLFQAATQVQEQSLSFAPKIIITFLSLMLCANWIARSITAFFMVVLTSIPHLVVK